MSILAASFIAYRLPSYHGNLSKRLIKSPKLHFYDSALACWLMGIRDTEQLRVHPLRGAIFESWVISEIIKARFNGGESNGVYFFRDREGLESDALVLRGTGVTLVEIKAGQTLSSDLATSVKRIAPVLAESGQKADSVVIYGGNETQRRDGITYLPWHAVQDYHWAG